MLFSSLFTTCFPIAGLLSAHVHTGWQKISPGMARTPSWRWSRSRCRRPSAGARRTFGSSAPPRWPTRPTCRRRATALVWNQDGAHSIDQLYQVNFLKLRCYEKWREQNFAKRKLIVTLRVERPEMTRGS